MILIVKAQIGRTGPVVTVCGRNAWAWVKSKAANENGCTPISHPGPRWSAFFALRNPVPFDLALMDGAA